MIMATKEIKEEQEETQELPDGFITKEEWVAKGRDPEEWRDPEEFKERGDKILPIVKKDRDRLKEEVSALRGDIEKIIEFNNKQEERLRQEGYNQALKEIESRRKEAVDNADYDELKKADADRDKIIIEKNKHVQPTNQSDPVFEDFKNRNAWYQTDKELTDWADNEGAAIATTAMKRGKNRADAFNDVETAIKKLFPEKFENKNREKAPSVETEATAKSKSGNGKGWDVIADPKERATAKASFKRIQTAMELKGRKYTEADYLADY